MGNFFGPFARAATSGSGPAAGNLSTVVLAAGANNNLAPATPYGRLDLDSTAGAANVTGLTAGTDGQSITIRNKPGGNDVILNNQNGGSAAGNQFLGPGGNDVDLPAGTAIDAVYYAGAINKWVLVP